MRELSMEITTKRARIMRFLLYYYGSFYMWRNDNLTKISDSEQGPAWAFSPRILHPKRVRPMMFLENCSDYRQNGVPQRHN